MESKPSSNDGSLLTDDAQPSEEPGADASKGATQSTVLNATTMPVSSSSTTNPAMGTEIMAGEEPAPSKSESSPKPDDSSGADPSAPANAEDTKTAAS